MALLEELVTLVLLAVAIAGGLLLRDGVEHLIETRRDVLPEQMSTGASIEPDDDVARETMDEVWTRVQAEAVSRGAADRRRRWQADARARTAEAAWWATPWGPFEAPRMKLLHDAGCRYAATAVAEPMRFLLTLDDAIARAGDDDVEVCAACDPLDGHTSRSDSAGENMPTHIPAPPEAPDTVGGAFAKLSRDGQLPRMDEDAPDVIAAAEGRYSFLTGRTVT